MSAFVVSDSTFNAIITGGIFHGLLEGKRPQAILKSLVTENYKSVNYRYGEKQNALVHTFKIHTVSDIQLLKSIECLGYQSCEHDTWESSDAYQFLDELKAKVYQSLGITEAEKREWGHKPRAYMTPIQLDYDKAFWDIPD